MRVPIRKGTGPIAPSQDPKMTINRYKELKEKLNYWLKIKRPKEAEEVKRLALMGDFSENVGYQVAKGRLRGLNQRIIELEKLLNRAEIIEKKSNNNYIEVGNTVHLKHQSIERKYQILGSSESDPVNGIISHVSPLGTKLLGKKVGDIIKIGAVNKETEYTITKIV